MDTVYKLVYGTMAVVFTGGGLYYLYESSQVTGYFSWLGIGQYVWFGILWLIIGLSWWYFLLIRPDLIP